MAQSVECVTLDLRVVVLSPTLGVEITYKIKSFRGPWVAQLVKGRTWAQVMNSWFTGSSPAWGSADSLEPASDSVSPLSLCPSPLPHPCSVCLSPSLKNKQTFKKNFFKVEGYLAGSIGKTCTFSSGGHELGVEITY